MGKDLKGKEIGKGIHQRPDGRYEGKYTDRFGKRRSVYAGSVRELKQRMLDAVVENESMKSVRKNITMDAWVKTWFETYKQYAVKPNTLREYDYIYKSFIKPKFGHKMLVDIFKVDVQELINEMHAKGYGYERQNKVRILILDICNRAIEDQLLVVNPARGVRVNGKKEKNTKVLSADEQEEFLEWAVTAFLYNAFQVQLNTGLRPGELFAIVPESINFERSIIEVRHTLVYQKYLDDERKTFHLEAPKTASSIRDIPINAVCREFLERQMRLKGILNTKYPTGVPYLFVSSLNNPLESQIYSDAIAAVIRNMNSQRMKEEEMWYFTGHTLRHSFATRCFEAGIQPKVVQGYLGHATLQMTMDLYTHVMPDVSAEGIEKICRKPSKEKMDRTKDDDRIIPFKKKPAVNE